MKPFIHYYKENETGRDFFTTDIHGCFDLLHEALKGVAFNGSKDRLFVGGDNADRGIDSQYVLDYLNEPWYISIRANHEEMLISTYEDGEASNAAHMLYFNGGMWYFDLDVDKKKAIYDSFCSLPLAIEYELKDGRKVGIIHAEVPYNDWEAFKNIKQVELKWNGEAIAQWSRTKYDKQDQGLVKNIDLVLAGHTPTKSGEIERLGNVLYCDAGSFFRDKIHLVEIKELLNELD